VALSALRGALGFLSRLPVGHSDAGWRAFQATPAAFPLAGWVLGGLLATAVLVPAPAPTVAFLYVAAVYLLTGVTHVDGVADLGDAAVIHGGPEDRLAVAKDSDVGTGAVLAVGVVLVGLAAATVAVAALPLAVGVALVVAAEVAAKLAMAVVVCVGTATHEGLASPFTEQSGVRSLAAPAVVAAPAALAAWPAVLPALAALGAALAVTLGVVAWSRDHLGGVNGDAIGAANELARVAALHAGVVAWTLS
jgi:adenosylcobinamide-GDP ribazoletransferase